MEKEKLLKELREKFERLKKELNLKVSFEELNEIFYLDDFILTSEFVSENLERQLRYRILDFYHNWANYLHGIVLPNPQSLFAMAESKMFNEEEKKKMMKLMTKILSYICLNSKINITNNKKDIAYFIDNSVIFWKKELKDELEKILTKVCNEWKKKSEESSN